MKIYQGGWKKKFLGPLASLLLYPLWVLYKLLQQPSKNLSQILIFEWYFLGDLVMISQCVRVLKDRYPEKEVILFCDDAWIPVGQLIPGVDRIVGVRCPWSPRYRDYSFRSLRNFWKQVAPYRRLGVFMTLSFRGDLRDHLLQGLIPASCRLGLRNSGCEYMLTHVAASCEIHQILLNNAVVEQIGLKPKYPELLLPPRRKNVAAFQELVACNFGASDPFRAYPVEHVARLDRAARRLGIVLHYFHCGELDGLSLPSAHRLRLEAYLEELASAVLFVGTDSASAHLAAAWNIPSIILYGPNDPNLVGPLAASTLPLLGICPYAPCYNDCRFDRAYCMESFLPSSLVSLIQSRISSLDAPQNPCHTEKKVSKNE